MKNKKRGKIFGLMVIGIVLIVVMANWVSAATLYWVGVNNGNWSDSSNWASSSGEINLNTIKNNNMYY